MVAAASLVIALASYGIYDASYGTGYLGDTSGSEPATETGSEDGRQVVGRGGGYPSDQASSPGSNIHLIEGSIPTGGPTYPVPDFQVIDYSTGADPATGVTVINFQVSTASLGEADLRGIAEEFAVKMTGYNGAGVLVYDANLEPHDANPAGDNPLTSSVDGSTLFPNAFINIDYSRGVYRISYSQ